MIKSKIIVDISHIIGWQGNLTGIERVEYHLIEHYFHNTEAEFIYWDRQSSVFVAADREQVKTLVIDRTSETELQNQQVSTKALNRFHKHVKKLVGKSVNAANIDQATVIILAGLWDVDNYIEGLKQLAQNNSLVHVVYDMIPLVTPGYVVDFLPSIFEKYFYSVLPVCKAVLAISKSSAEDTRQVLLDKGLKVPAIDSFQLGSDITRAQGSQAPKGVQKAFILSVGTLEARKNHTLLYYAYKELLSQGKKLPQLVIAGRSGWLTENLQYLLAHDPDVKDYILVTGSVTDAELTWLYEHCRFTVFPSFYEGWGLPVVESLAHGKVTLSANTSSLPEAGGNYADYFSPLSTDELTKLIVAYLDDAKLAKREAQIKGHDQTITWRTASKTFADKVTKLTV